MWALMKPGTANLPVPSMTLAARKPSGTSPIAAILSRSIMIFVKGVVPSGSSARTFLMSVFIYPPQAMFRYAFCSGVSASMAMPDALSLISAIFVLISSGMRWTPFAISLP